MRLTKDEARILAVILDDAKYDLVSRYHDKPHLMDRLQNLEDRLLAYSKDKRRVGRASMDDFSDCLKRFIKNGNHE